MVVGGLRPTDLVVQVECACRIASFELSNRELIDLTDRGNGSCRRFDAVECSLMQFR